MDNVFLALAAFSLMAAALGLMAALELIIKPIIESNRVRIMLVSCISIMGAGSLIGLLLYCVFAVLGWLGIVAAVAFGCLQWACASYLEHKEEYRPPMAVYKEIQ